ncbi:DNA polymerase III subunit delta [Rhodobium gokarnense]|uniref:DNA polymerase III subunit delta n=1 Tax=Rhodobium gokarnense TaxID=364296 RepID=A0ABT3HE92_9HYPH|nr:DNA polymerase III subunit delta [Rhodobium gokarnense]MCW2308654.1 DNA polymerase-3 subunit delta [Rhodobium gokarnense]
MALIKGRDIDRFLKSPPADLALVLVFGPDTGLVNERCKALVKTATAGSEDPFALVTLDASEIASDPSRLADEALQIAMFGDRRTVWVRNAGTQNIVPAVEPLIAEPPTDSLVVIEAGDLKKGTGLRRRFEADSKAVAIACYADAAADLDRLMDEEANAAGLEIDRDARQALHALIGADRLASRGELAKLCLYARGDKRITIEHVAAVVGDASGLAVDELIDAVFAGSIDQVVRNYRRMIAAGTSPASIGTATLRHMQMLHRARADVDAGSSAETVVARARPPIFFRRRPHITRALSRWSSHRLEHAMGVLNEAILNARRLRDLEDEILGEALLLIARAARAPG